MSVPDDSRPSEDQETVSQDSFLKRLYNRILAESETRRGPAVLATISFAESSFFPIPPDPLLIALGIGNPKRAIPLAVLTTLASVAGGWLGYAIGAWAFDSVGVAILDFFQAHEIFEEVREGFIDVGFIAVLAAALTPLPYKVFTIASGAAGMPLGIFTLASLAGRGIRFMAEGILIRIYGEKIKGFLERWFGWISIGALVMGVLGFVALKFFV